MQDITINHYQTWWVYDSRRQTSAILNNQLLTNFLLLSHYPVPLSHYPAVVYKGWMQDISPTSHYATRKIQNTQSTLCNLHTAHYATHKIHNIDRARFSLQEIEGKQIWVTTNKNQNKIKVHAMQCTDQARFFLSVRNWRHANLTKMWFQQSTSRSTENSFAA